MAFNNLAHVLTEQGELQKAEAEAQHAFELGGPQQDTFFQTLEEIKCMKKGLSENMNNYQTDGAYIWRIKSPVTVGDTTSLYESQREN